ncbi:MAG TPA: HAMP domain-containing histidine kinase [Sulfurimonas sp.]|nr:HAMP domain-containing histidine kinase [Sulfurimonas sp.]
MSALNAMVISSPEFKSLRGFIILYTFMWILILSLLASIYYENEKEMMLAEHRLSMQLVNETHYVNMFYKYIDSGDELPKSLAYRTAVFDSNKKVLASYIKEEPRDFTKFISLDGDYVHCIVRVGVNDMNVKYLVYETDDNRLWWTAMIKNMFLYGTFLFLFITFIGFNLVKLFLRPMRESIELLDNFIKDTTHELNTPVSVIVANIEGINLDKLEEKERKKIRRVDIAARTISNIYNDLTYLILHNDVIVKDEEIDLSHFICERVDYFKVTMNQKKIIFVKEIKENIHICMDKNKLSRLVDNLLSNAIKYNKINGEIRIVLKEGYLEISDTGIGIPEEKLSTVFERYQRANDVVGGFGIGLNIVAMIAKEYKFSLDIKSELNKGTEISLLWESSQLP